jgi:hypothetical protein
MNFSIKLSVKTFVLGIYQLNDIQRPIERVVSETSVLQQRLGCFKDCKINHFGSGIRRTQARIRKNSWIQFVASTIKLINAVARPQT